MTDGRPKRRGPGIGGDRSGAQKNVGSGKPRPSKPQPQNLQAAPATRDIHSSSSASATAATWATSTALARQHRRAWAAASGRGPAGRPPDRRRAPTAALQALGWREVPVTVVDLDKIVRGEFAENAHRKHFLPSEIDAIRRTLEPIERAAAKERMSDGAKGMRKFPHPSGQDLRQDRRVRRRVAAARSRRSPPWSRPPRPSRRSSASCSTTWTAPAAPTASIGGSRSRIKPEQLFGAEPPPLPGNGPVSRHRRRPALAVREGRRRPLYRGTLSLSARAHRKHLRCSMSLPLRMRIRSSGFGSPTTTCGKPLASSTHGASSKKRS